MRSQCVKTEVVPTLQADMIREYTHNTVPDWSGVVNRGSLLGFSFRVLGFPRLYFFETSKSTLVCWVWPFHGMDPGLGPLVFRSFSQTSAPEQWASVRVGPLGQPTSSWDKRVPKQVDRVCYTPSWTKWRWRRWTSKVPVVPRATLLVPRFSRAWTSAYCWTTK